VPEKNEPQWLDKTEQAAWLALAGLMFRVPGVLDAQLLRDSNLTLFEYFVLSGLSMRDEHTARMSELAQFVNGSQSRLSNVVKRLEQRGLVRREASPENGRHINAILTGEGWEVVKEAAPGHVAAVRQFIFDTMSAEEVECVRKACDRIVERADPHATWPRVDRPLR
jgi:DNA-binding MarR family transcriptional regulator